MVACTAHGAAATGVVVAHACARRQWCGHQEATRDHEEDKHRNSANPVQKKLPLPFSAAMTLSRQNLRGIATPTSIASAAVGGVLGSIISVVVNNALIEISITPFFATVFGIVLVLLGGLMIWRKLFEEHQYPMTRLLVLAFSTLVLLSGVACFLLEKDWFNKIPPRAKVPMYMFLGISLCFAVAFSLVDLLNLYSDRCSTFARRGQPLVSSPPQIFLVLAGAILMGASFGLMFGAMDVEDDDASHRKLRTEERASLPIGFVLGALVGCLNSLVGTSHHREGGFGIEADLLRSDGLLDD